MSSGGPGMQKHLQLRTIDLDHCPQYLHCSLRATIALLKSAPLSDLIKGINHHISSPSLNISMVSFALRTQFKLLTFLLLSPPVTALHSLRHSPCLSDLPVSFPLQGLCLWCSLCWKLFSSHRSYIDTFHHSGSISNVSSSFSWTPWQRSPALQQLLCFSLSILKLFFICLFLHTYCLPAKNVKSTRGEALSGLVHHCILKVPEQNKLLENNWLIKHLCVWGCG